MRIQFPLQLSVGTDIIRSSRLLNYETRDQHHLSRLATRFLHQKELDVLNGRFPYWQRIEHSSAKETQKLADWLAGRWAAKEAGKKAWHANLLGWKDVRVEKTSPDGEVQLVCCPSDSSTSQYMVEQVAKLSISHDGGYAVATVLATPLHEAILAELRRRKIEAEANIGKHGSSSSMMLRNESHGINYNMSSESHSNPRSPISEQVGNDNQSEKNSVRP